jgi:hypothetical protein
MKRILLFLGFIGIVAVNSANAQLAWGARVGLSMGVLSSNIDEMDGAPGIEFGPLVYYALSEKTYLNSGLMFSFKNLKLESPEEKVKDELLYLDLPVYFGYAFGSGSTTFYAQAGPVFGFNLSAKEKYSYYDYQGEKVSDTHDFKDELNSFNAGLGIAFGVNIKKFKIELGYQHGLTNILKDDDDDDSVKLGSAFLGISYVF